MFDCSTLDYGCNGGWATNAFKYIRDQGVSNGTRYKYTGVPQKCKRTVNRYKSILKVQEVCEVFLSGDENLLKSIIANYGPVSGAIGK